MVESVQSTRITQALDKPEAPTRISTPITIFKRKQNADVDSAQPAKRQRTQVRRAHSSVVRNNAVHAQMDRKDVKTSVLGVLTRSQEDPLTFKEIKARVGEVRLACC